jgi:Zn-dependent peptidase ImmA (M78 family)
MKRVNWRKPQAAAKKLLEELGITEPPIPVERIARHMGAEVRYKKAERDISGFIARQDDGSFIIGINSFHHAHRQRFTLAHEIGHLCLHTSKKLYVDHVPKFRDVKSSQAVDPEEIEANIFAAELLMPEEMLRSDIQSMRDDLNANEAIDRLAKRYQVSPEAMRSRLERLKGIGFES